METPSKNRKFLHYFSWIWALFFLTITRALFSDPYSVGFVHIGPQLPLYMSDAIEQVRLFNPHALIFLVANRCALINFQSNDKRLVLVALEDLTCTRQHQVFRKNSKMDLKYLEAFWNHAIERFFYLDELMIQYELENLFHLENDVMLYVDLNDVLPVFTENYSGIGAVFDNDERCIPGFLFFRNPAACSLMTSYMAEQVKKGMYDMQIIGEFKNRFGSYYIDHLPIVTPEYSHDYPLTSKIGVTAANADVFSRHVGLFASVFDAAALGQYLGGIDPIHRRVCPGFINESCIFDPSFFTYEWECDAKGRKVPFMVYKNSRLRINNLHIHSKNLQAFRSQ